MELTDNELIIDWDEDPPHRSVFPISWLISHAYDRKQEAQSHRENILWDKAWLNAHSPEWIDLKSGDCKGQEIFYGEAWKYQLSTLGFTILRNLPFEDLDSFLLSIGPIYYTEYGRYAPVKTKPGANDLGETGYPLSPHTDYPNRYNPPLMVCFYMVENTASGGESILVDGFRIAQDFRRQHPHYFRILTEIPVQFQQFYTDFKYFYRRAQTILELDREGQIVKVNFGHSHACNWKIPFEQMERFYQAYSAFFSYLKNPAYQYQVRLQPGNLLLMYNDRILHGRKEFDSNSGMRHLEVAYMVWDYFTARNDFDRYQHLYLEK